MKQIMAIFYNYHIKTAIFISFFFVVFVALDQSDGLLYLGRETHVI